MTEEKEEEIKLLNLIFFATSLHSIRAYLSFFYVSVVVYAAYSTPSLALSDAL